MKVSFAVAILYYMLCSVHTFNFLPGRIQTNFVRRGRILSVTQQKDVANAVTMPYTLPTAAYKSVVLQSPYNDTMEVFLIQENALLQDGTAWSGRDDYVFSEPVIEELLATRQAFRVNADGMRRWKLAVQRREENTRRPLKPLLTSANIYKNIGNVSEPVYQKISSVDEHTQSVETLGDSSTTSAFKSKAFSKLYRNMSELFYDEAVARRSDQIAMKLKREYDFGSPEWKRWVRVSERQNTTTLTHVLAEYFSGSSTGDIGHSDIDYVPQRGYPGTLAPGEKFPQQLPLDDLPKKLLHPWPAFQQIQYHVRWPVPFPYAPSPVLWIALNNLMVSSEQFNANTTEENKIFLAEAAAARIPDEVFPHANELRSVLLELAGPSSTEHEPDVAGGDYSEEADAIYIAKHCREGSSYDLAEQIPHPAFNFTHGHTFPHYRPEHPATLPEKDVQPPIPEVLVKYITPWYEEDRAAEKASKELAFEKSQLMPGIDNGFDDDDDDGALLLDPEESARKRKVAAMMAQVTGGEDMVWQREEKEYAKYVHEEAIRRIRAEKEEVIERERIRMQMIPTEELDDEKEFFEEVVAADDLLAEHGGESRYIDEEEGDESELNRSEEVINARKPITDMELEKMKRHVNQELRLKAGRRITPADERDRFYNYHYQRIVNTVNARHEPRNSTNATQWKRFRRGKLVDDNNNEKEGGLSRNGGDDLVAVTPGDGEEAAAAAAAESSEGVV